MKTLALLVVLVACNKANPNYCPDHPDNNCNEPIVDAGSDGNSNCAVTGCVGGGVCDTGKNMCVQCTPANTSACTSTTPVCGLDETCQPCRVDNECADSNVCRADGSCALVANVLYASTTGSGTAACTQADKCSLAHALTLVDATHTIVHLDAGTYTDNGIVLSGTVTLTGHGVTLDRSGGSPGPVVSVSAGANATLELMTITGGHSGIASHAIGCANATLSVHAATLQVNTGNGINAATCDIEVDRSSFYKNESGGIFFTSVTTTSKFDLSNNFVFHNGNNSSAMYGGIYIVPQNVGASRLEFNTVVDNDVATGVANFAGISCDVSAVGAANNIVARNRKNTVATGQQTQGACGFLTSKVQDDISGLDFVRADSGEPYIYKIGTNSSAKDMATTSSLVDIDADGDHRPQGNVKDIGADEYKAP